MLISTDVTVSALLFAVVATSLGLGTEVVEGNAVSEVVSEAEVMDVDSKLVVLSDIAEDIVELGVFSAVDDVVVELPTVDPGNGGSPAWAIL